MEHRLGNRRATSTSRRPQCRHESGAAPFAASGAVYGAAGTVDLSHLLLIRILQLHFLLLAGAHDTVCWAGAEDGGICAQHLQGILYGRVTVGIL